MALAEVPDDGIIRINYTPRPQFAPFHNRKERFACLVCHRRAGKTAVSQQLREVGIPGIRYLDQGSRNIPKLSPFIGGSAGPEFQITAKPNATHNYVVFNPDIIDILRKYGFAGLTGGLSASMLPASPVPNQVSQ